MDVKTAISLPDATFERASRRAKELGMSRSEFFARAAESYLDELDAQTITERIDTALADFTDDDSAAAAVAAGHRLLASSGDDW